MKEKIGVIGQGFVGSAVREGMSNYFDMVTFDKDPNKESTVNSIFGVIENTEVTFLCVPTPMKKSGDAAIDAYAAFLTNLK